MFTETPPRRQIILGTGLAVIATLIWSGNFIIARGVIEDIPPVTLGFYRWLTATVIIFPFAWKYFIQELNFLKHSPGYLLLTAVTGVSMFNTFVYIAGHYSTAINMALLGTCSSPIISVILARIFLHEKITGLKIIGMAVCIAGILLLLSKGNLQNLIHFRFTRGDGWILAAAFTFAVYNILVKRKPSRLHPANFLFVIFFIGTVLLMPFYFTELKLKGSIAFNLPNLLSILYLGMGASVICFLIWNKAIGILGAGRTALFGNLIPVFSSIEAVILLHEKITVVDMISFILVVAGLVIANFKK